MFVSGRCLLHEFPQVLKEIVTSPSDPNDPASPPMWSMISSNIGTTLNDDGYVFFSQGSDGNQEIYVGIKNALHATSSSWYWGYRVFVAEKYTPASTQGQNGTFSNVLYDGMAVASGAISGYNETNFPIDYWVHVTKDRIVFAVTGVPRMNNIRNVIYLGRPGTVFNPNDKYCTLLAVGYGRDYNNNVGYARTIGFNIGVSGQNYPVWLTGSFNYRNPIFKQYIVSNIVMVQNSAFRGLLDIYALSGGGLRPVDHVKIGNVEYLAVYLNNVSIEGSTRYVQLYHTVPVHILIPKA